MCWANLHKKIPIPEFVKHLKNYFNFTAMKKYILVNLAILSLLATVLVISFKPATENNTTGKSPLTEQNVLGIIYQQQAAEYRALCFQAYNIGMHKIDEAKKRKNKNPLAVVTDLDETAIDNSGYAVRCYTDDHGYTDESWNKWCNDAVADSVPGSVSFFKYADRKGITIFYVSNRSAAALAKTMENMKRLGFPQVSEEHFKLKTTTSSKEERRKEILKKYSIVALLGDNLVDMDAAFDKAPENVRTHSADSLRNVWGDRYIVFPNATYGDWESVLYQNYRNAHGGKYPPSDSVYGIRNASMKKY